MTLPRALFVGRTRFRVPLDPPTQEKYDAIGRELDYLVLASAADGGGAAAAPCRFERGRENLARESCVEDVPALRRPRVKTPLRINRCSNCAT